MDGWLKLWRQTIENPYIFRDCEYFSIWIYLLIQAKFEETPSRFNGKEIILKPGQFTIGRKQISAALKISESKIQRVLKVFENEHQIEQQTCNTNRLITIINWEHYQGNGQQNEPQMNSKRTTSEQQMNTPKEIKKERTKEKDIKDIGLQFDFEGKEKILDFVWLKPAEKERFIQDFGSQSFDDLVERLDAYLTDRPERRPGGKDQYFDHNKTLRNWMKKEPVKPKEEKPKILTTCYDPYTGKDIV